MKAIDLAKKLLKHPDFEVIFTDFNNGDVLDFDDVDVTDIGYSDKIIILGGKSDDVKREHKDNNTLFISKENDDKKVQILKKMMQHQPFGWLKCEDDDTIFQIIEISPKGITISEEGFIETHEDLNYFSTCCFLDGTKFL